MVFPLRHFFAAAFLCFTIAATPAPIFAATPLVSMNVQQAEIRDVLTALSYIAHVSIIADDSVAGKVTVQLTNIPFETALDLITRTKNLSYRRFNDIIVVASAERTSWKQPSISSSFDGKAFSNRTFSREKSSAYFRIVRSIEP